MTPPVGRGTGRIRVLRRTRRAPVFVRLLRRAVEAALRRRRATGTRVDVIVVNNATIRWWHRRVFGDAAATDVISVSYPRLSVGDAPDAEIVVSLDQARREARLRRIPLAEELTRYVVHGVLHHLGYEDGTRRERARMFREQEKIVHAVIGDEGFPRRGEGRGRRRE